MTLLDHTSLLLLLSYRAYTCLSIDNYHCDWQNNNNKPSKNMTDKNNSENNNNNNNKSENNLTQINEDEKGENCLAIDTKTKIEIESEQNPTVSKKQLKRMQRHEKWIASKVERRKREKEKRKQKIAAKILAGERIVSRKQLRRQLISQRDSPCKVSIVIDCDYADYMSEHEMKKLCKQLNRCYSTNKHSAAPAQLFITSITGPVKSMLETYQSGYSHWDAHCTEQHWTELFLRKIESSQSSQESKSNIIYLSGDSEHRLPPCEQIHNNSVFIIGGLIDHNRHKGLALKRATCYAVASARLPIDVRMSQRQILAIPHVFEIMLYAANGSIGSNWNDIFRAVIPNRKLTDDGDDDDVNRTITATPTTPDNN